MYTNIDKTAADGRSDVRGISYGLLHHRRIYSVEPKLDFNKGARLLHAQFMDSVIRVSLVSRDFYRLLILNEVVGVSSIRSQDHWYLPRLLRLLEKTKV